MTDTDYTIAVTSSARYKYYYDGDDANDYHCHVWLSHGMTISTQCSGFNKTHNCREYVLVTFLWFRCQCPFSFLYCRLLATLPTSAVGMVAARIWLVDCYHPMGSDILSVQGRTWTRSIMLLPGYDHSFVQQLTSIVPFCCL